MSPISILIIEDEEPIRRGLCDVFVYNGYQVDAASDGQEGLSKALSGRYHLVILDVMLPGKNGFEVCHEIRKVDRAQPIILLTAKGDEEDKVKGLKAGADDYVSKPFSVRELLARAESVLRRSGKLVAQQEKIIWKTLELDPPNLRVMVRGTNNASHPPSGEKTVDLTQKEMDLLRYLIQRSERPVGRKELLKEVWGYGHTQMDTRTVDIHITKLRRKIEADPENPSRILTIRGGGYRMG